MKLSFMKNEKLEVSVAQKIGEEHRAFNYIDMINSLIKHQKLDDPEITGGFSESEKESILSMITHINNEVSDFFNEDKEENK